MLEFYLNEDLGWSEAEYENLDEVFLEDIQEGRGTVVSTSDAQIRTCTLVK